MRFKLLRGIHIGPGPDGCQCQRCQHTKQFPKSPKGHIYHRDDIIDSDIDLAARFNGPPGYDPKFQRLNIHETGDGLDAMTVAELRAHAESEEIELPKGNIRREELIKIIREAPVPV